MFRYVINRLRADGVTNLVSVMVLMAYMPWIRQSWLDDLYPGDDVVDWVGLGRLRPQRARRVRLRRLRAS